MAKISAHGATEIARFKTPDGSTYVLTSDSRILVKVLPTDAYHVISRYKVADQAARAFAALRYLFTGEVA